MAEEQIPGKKPEQTLFWELTRKKFTIMKMASLLLVFWLAEFAYQYFLVSAGSFEDSIIRSSSLGGALLIAISLLIGPVQVLFPKYNYIDRRRAFAVGGFALIIAHSLTVTIFRFGGDFLSTYSELNPFQSAMAYGIFAFWLIFPLLLTSTDWAMRKLKFQNWKLLHRTVYFSWILAIMHSVLMNPAQMRNIAGYALLLVSALVFFLEFFAFAKRVRASASKIALASGIAVMLLLASLLFITWPMFVKALEISL